MKALVLERKDELALRDFQEALRLQRPLPDAMLEIVAEGQRSDQPEAV